MRQKLVDFWKNEYRFITFAVDSYENGQIKGRLYHDALSRHVYFDGWTDWLMLVNQIHDETEVPKRTVDMRTFGFIGQRELPWKESESAGSENLEKGKVMTFRLQLTYRYYASWQGEVTWMEGDKNYSFLSFLKLLNIMDYLLKGREPEQFILSDPGYVCQIAVNRYEGSSIEGDIQRAAVRYKRKFSSISELAGGVSEASANPLSEEQLADVKIISGETLGYYRKGGKEATFVVRVLYREHSTWQGEIYCRERKEEKSFRSFMEMLYLMVSALEANTVVGAGNCNTDFINQDHINKIG